MIHNGIIENHASLRATLQGQGHVFASETDTEVIPHLIEEFLKSEPSFSAAFLGAMKLLVGAYGIAAAYAGEPETIFVARHGSPIVLGLGKNKTLVASDPAPLVAHTRDVIYLDDGEIALLHGDGFETKTLEGTSVSKSVQQIAFSLPDIERGGFPHFMLKEITEQPESIRNAFRGRIVRAEGTAKLGGVDEALLRRVKRCHIVACGTSWHAGLDWQVSPGNACPDSHAGLLRFGVPLRAPGAGAGYSCHCHKPVRGDGGHACGDTGSKAHRRGDDRSLQRGRGGALPGNAGRESTSTPGPGDRCRFHESLHEPARGPEPPGGPPGPYEGPVPARRPAFPGRPGEAP